MRSLSLLSSLEKRRQERRHIAVGHVGCSRNLDGTQQQVVVDDKRPSNLMHWVACPATTNVGVSIESATFGSLLQVALLVVAKNYY